MPEQNVRGTKGLKATPGAYRTPNWKVARTYRPIQTTMYILSKARGGK